jgi:hypothetical protein
MPDVRRSRLAGVVGAVAALGLAVGTPGVLAADTHWAGSQFTTPFVDGVAIAREPSFPIGGVFVKSRAQNPEPIASVEVAFQDPDSPEEEPEEPVPPGPTAPPPEDDEVQCVPDDLDPSEVPNDSPGSGDETADRWEFTVPTEHSVWPCNGRYDVVATARTASGDVHTMTGELDVAVRPAPVEVVDVVVGEDERTVKITWEPLSADQLAVDALGYRVERAGPGTTEGAFPAFLPLGTDRPLDGEPVATDSPREAGVYRYRVRSLREGPGGPVPASAEVSGFADGTVIGDPASTTTSQPRRPSGGVITRPPSRSVPRIGTATTIDTGFEGELDYGDREPGDSPELAGDSGRSIIRTDDGVGLVAPVAGALVLLGWAGHIVYLNRLARQF